MNRSVLRWHGLLGRLGLGLVLPALALTAAAPAQAWPAFPRADVAGDWFAQTLTAAGAAGPGLQGSRVSALGWLSARRALDAGPAVPATQRPHFEDAAVATAVHDALVALVPSRAAALDAALVSSLAAVPDGHGERAGIRAGQQAAAATLRDRENDGLDPASVNRPFTAPPPAPGVYRVPPDAVTPTVIAGLGEARPFLLDRADRFRAGPPPALGTDAYRRDLREVQRLGSATATERTQRQTETALLWGQDSFGAYTAALRPLVADPNRSLAWKVRLVAAFTTVTVDALIAVADTKYTYLWWRPITAIRDADTDGDPRTRPDPGWTPLLPTPAHPEYAAGHPGFAGAAEQVLERFVGARAPVSFTITATTGTGQVVSREYDRGTPWSALTQENVDARVWAGAHFRHSDETGAAIGRRVADYDLARLG